MQPCCCPRDLPWCCAHALPCLKFTLQAVGMASNVKGHEKVAPFGAELVLSKKLK